MPEIILLTGKIHSSKSESLLNWASDKSISGIITPTVSGKKVMVDIATNQQIAYQLDAPSINTISIGNYHLNQMAFEFASKCLRNALIIQREWLVLDEIGKLELTGNGHHNILKEILIYWKNKIILVVRDSLIEEVISSYAIKISKIIQKEELLELH